MSNYTKTTDFAAKDALLTGNPSKLVKGTEINVEFSNIQTAVNSKLDSSGVTAFAATLLDDIDAATARGTLVAAKSGANADITSMTGLSNGGIPLVKVSGAAASGANTDITALNYASGVTGITAVGTDNTTKLATTAQVQGAITSRIATQGQTNAVTDDTVTVTPLKLGNGLASAPSVIGYLKLPAWLGGFVFQWGNANASSSADTSVSFPLTFPNSIYLVTGTAVSTAHVSFVVVPTAVSTSAFSCNALSAGGRNALGFYWFAFGK